MPEILEASGFVKQPILSVIRAKCLDCCSGAKEEVKLCPSNGEGGASACSLWPYRLGTDPFRKRTPLSVDEAHERACRLNGKRANCPLT